MLDLANEHRLRTRITLRQLLTMQDVAVVEGDRQWQMSEFRRKDLAGSGSSTRAAGSTTDELSPAQASSRERLMGGLAGLTQDAILDAAALTQQASKAGVTFEEAKRRSLERVAARPPVRVGRRARGRAESGADDG